MIRSRFLTPLFLLVFAAVTSVSAQSKPGGTPYVFPQFVQGSVQQKGGGVTDGMLNYNTVSQEMLFLQGSEKIVLDAGNIDTVVLQGRKFIPVNNVFYEKLTNTKVALYQQHANEMKSRVKNSDLAQQSNNTVTSSQGFRSAVNQSSKYELTISDDYTLDPHDMFWLQKGKSFTNASDLKKILKVFPTVTEAAANTFIKDKGLDIKKAEDLKQLIVFCNQ
ncbi:hypothetical protein HQ865_18615 [Mucilaginibacter mali]|uniref:DUF4476 domain-containing protein n=1 Tax=Mucilaginibacter mali TaxID=2740462 RepID=A0A7D4QH53_9SPHI|nr:hypothetical protein [Mucilaginibacter mali]QKJ31692.1 hypothetical protein HQ865_18615 [Mucilaginibacter mali]